MFKILDLRTGEYLRSSYDISTCHDPVTPSGDYIVETRAEAEDGLTLLVDFANTLQCNLCIKEYFEIVEV